MRRSVWAGLAAALYGAPPRPRDFMGSSGARLEKHRPIGTRSNLPEDRCRVVYALRDDLAGPGAECARGAGTKTFNVRSGEGAIRAARQETRAVLLRPYAVKERGCLSRWSACAEAIGINPGRAATKLDLFGGGLGLGDLAPTAIRQDLNLGVFHSFPTCQTRFLFVPIRCSRRENHSTNSVEGTCRTWHGDHLGCGCPDLGLAFGRLSEGGALTPVWF